MGTKIILPKDKDSKVNILHDLYKSIDCKSDIEIFNKILDMTIGTSIRSLKKYKQEFNWRRERHPNKVIPNLNRPLQNENQTVKRLCLQELIRLDNLDQEQKLILIQNICSLYSTGEVSLKTACDNFNIPTGVFLKWSNTDSAFFKLYNQAKEQNESNFAKIIESLASENLIKLLQGFKYNTEQTIYEIVDNMEIPVRKVITSNEYNPDISVLKYAEELNTKLKEQENVSFRDVKDMTMEELLEEAKSLLRELK